MEIYSHPDFVLEENPGNSAQMQKEGDGAALFDRFDNERLADHTQVQTLADLMLSQDEWKDKLSRDDESRRRTTVATAIHGGPADAAEKIKKKFQFLPSGHRLARALLPHQRSDLVALYRHVRRQRDSATARLFQLNFNP